MKKLVLISGTMGVGKSTVCEVLLRRTEHSVYLDGDWCWKMHPFVVNEENKRMVMDHITHLLRGFLRNSQIQTVYFCWVMHEQAIVDEILHALREEAFVPIPIALTCTQAELARRMRARGEDEAAIARSVARLPLYAGLRTTLLDVSELSVEQTAERIMAHIRAQA